MYIKPKAIWLRESFSWMGSYSGYDQICNAIENLSPGRYHNVARSPKLLGRITRKLIAPQLTRVAAKVKSSETYNETSTFMELRALCQCLFAPQSFVHVLYVERMLGLLTPWQARLPYKLVATAHQPAALWRLQRHQPEALSKLDGLIVLSSREVDFFEAFLPERVHLILHGVDTDFFRPEPVAYSSAQPKQPRFTFSGTWLRDIDTLAQVVDKVLQINPSIGFDMVVPISKRQQSAFIRIARHEQVRWHADISDEQLRDLYCQATALVLPLIDCTANNALVESIACGSPVISNDVGGMPDYTRSSFATLLPSGDVDGFVEAILTSAESPQARMEKGKAAREFAETNLSWSVIANQTLSFYRKVNTTSFNF